MSKFIVEIFSGTNETLLAESVAHYINGLSNKDAGEAAANIQWKTCAVGFGAELSCYITAIVSYWER